MKIAMLGHKAIPSHRGGIETVLSSLCPRLAQRGLQVTCYNRSGDPVEKALRDEIRKGAWRGVRLKCAPTLPLRGASAMLASHTAALRAAFSGCDVVHFHAEGPSAAMWIPKLFGKKCVATVHGLDHQREKWKSGFGARYILFGEKMLVKKADEIIVLSRSAEEYFWKTYGRKTVLIPNGIEKAEPKEADGIRDAFGLEKDSYVAVVARLTAEKGIHYLLEAWKRVRSDKKLVIVGDTGDTKAEDPYVRRLKEMAKGDDSVLFTGFLSGDLLREIYSNAYLICLPSDLEGMSLSLLEALSYGNATLLSDIAENASVAEEHAFYFKHSDPADLARVLEELLNDPEGVKKKKEGASSWITEKYSWEAVADRTAALYESLLKSKRKGS